MGKNSAVGLLPTTITGPCPAARQLCTASEAADPTASASSRQDHWRLLRRLLSPDGKKVNNVKKILEDYTVDGKLPDKIGLVRFIKELRKRNRFDHALQISEWMESKQMNFGPANRAIHLDLLLETKGTPAVEEYFDGLSSNAKNQLTYGSLFNCYCKKLMAEKALALFKKMDEMGFLNSPLPFNNLMTMHLRLGQPEKALELVGEMKLRKVSLDNYSYNMWMQSYGRLNDIAGVERVLEEMKKCGGEGCSCGWTTYSNLANLYVKAGEFKKAESALKILEAEMTPDNREAYHFLITLYAATSNLGEVRRVWNKLKLTFRVTYNLSYLFLIPALSKLNDMEGVKKWFKDWESTCRRYDVRVVDVAIKAYLDHGLYDDAVFVFEGAMKRSKHKLFKAREMFMVSLLRGRRLNPALEHLKALFSECKEVGVKCQLKQETVDQFFKCFEEQKDVDRAEELCKMLKLCNSLDSNAYHMLLKVYAAAGKVDPKIRQLSEGDSTEISSELKA